MILRAAYSTSKLLRSLDGALSPSGDDTGSLSRPPRLIQREVSDASMLISLDRLLIYHWNTNISFLNISNLVLPLDPERTKQGLVAYHEQSAFSGKTAWYPTDDRT